ncbi:hypothetical protein pdam_00001389 [Pocillopora damicornis]|uniref:Neurotransmitter-gated ion-channel ligand-binding domain-containing protein n=1 Tax=Pocillopora damicornis TaxID=46731 RepID=A0A3M6V3X8_POCDA|nr:hypothetical protein pdam_00001389 [Pocillopora damicornis]
MKATRTLWMDSKINLWVLLLLASVRSIHCGDDVVTSFFSDYDNAVRPGFAEQAKETIVDADIYVESFGNIEEANMEYRVYTYFRQKWTDGRLAGKLNRTLTIKGGDIENIWVPDPYCYNARESNMMMPDEETHSSVTIQPSGDVLYSKGYTTEDIVFEWNTTEVAVGTKAMAQFVYEGSKLSSDINVFSIGNYSTITVTFSFKRRIGYYIIQVYFPDIFVVALSWIVFWMDKDDMGNRMALGITTILTIMFLLGSLNGTLPKVSYPKALDWYLLISFTFVFFAMVECMIVFVLTLSASEDKEKIKCKVKEKPLGRMISQSIKSAIGANKGADSSVANNHITYNKGFGDDDLEMVDYASKSDKSVVDDSSLADLIGKSKKETAADFVDKVSRYLFPLLFIAFNVAYWVFFTIFV